MQSLIEKNIENGAYTLAPRRKGKSFVWNVLAEVLKEDGTVVLDYVYCRSCRHILRCVGNQTSNLSRHRCCKELKNTKIKQVGYQDKTHALHTLSNWIVEDCLPFSVVSGAGFKAMVQLFIKIGSIYGEFVDVDDLLPDETTIPRKCKKEADEKRETLSIALKEVERRSGISLTMDLWTDNNAKRTFLGVMVHFEQNYQMVNRILGLKSMETASPANVLEKLQSLLNTFGIDSLENIKFITDQTETNILQALESNIRLNCSTQLFTQVLDTAFNETTELMDLLQECKRTIKYLRKENLENKLNISLKSSYMTGWHSNYIMCESFNDNWQDINNILSESNKNHKFIHIDLNTLNGIVELCKNFEIIFNSLKNAPSLCFVFPSIYKVESLCEADPSDSVGVLSLKENIQKYVNEIWEKNLSIWHKIAFFLYPPALNMKLDGLNEIKSFCVSEIDKIPCTENKNQIPKAPPIELSIKSVRTLPTEKFTIKSENISDSENSCSQSPTPSDKEECPSSSKKERIDTNKFFFSSLIKKSEKTKETTIDEINKYCKERVSITEDFEVIDWWKSNQHYYPQLYKFALQVHSIPASSVAAEISFSLARSIRTEKRNRLTPHSLDSLMFLHSFYKSQKDE